MTHFYSDFIFCKNNFFQNAKRISDFANSLEFSYTHKSFPGTRTENLATSNNPECKDFANFFVAKLLNEVYTNILEATIDVRFHKYPAYEDNELNTGWVHIDDTDLLAGVLYLNNNFENFNAGTSFFTPNHEITPPDKIREHFNLDHTAADIDKYKESLARHNNQFNETIKIGNLYNRLITYDSNLFHKPNDYYINNTDSRLILVFVISKYSYKNREYEITE
jgi:hypothetical protein